MVSNFSVKKIVSISIILVTLAICFNLFINKFFIIPEGKKINCESFFTIESDLTSVGVMSFHINGISSGRMRLSATVTDRIGVKYNLLRYVNFDYRYDGDGYISFEQVYIIKNLGDNMPDEFFNKYIFDFSVKERKMRITEVGDSYMLWNDFSPVMMCTPNK
ncbi:hypothetical protein N5863_29080 (plasmid) [Klebsiella pasteurii]|uniref:hypothetical protein n=1 Tax=Klebsiella pasteurii TaxID=2587529 RepID=UPI002542D566|nr:hypothetical protein [Klebsiella pasteurii]WII85148.1 hypothetical protein N5863_29080 [Klebsiella pasteurii]